MTNPQLKLLDWQGNYIQDKSRFVLLAASRQSGKSFTIALKRLLRALEGVRLGVLLSRGERQSLELMEKVKMHCQILGAVMDEETTFFRDTSLLQHTAKFPNNCRVIALPANPDTARGFSADVDLDEFALHQDSREIWRALAPVATRGYSVAMSSTFKGTENEFYRIAKDLGLHLGIRPDRQPVKAKRWSGHWVDVHMVREQGGNIDIEALREAIGDEEIWMEEFCNVPISGAENYFPTDLVLACQSEQASVEWDGRPRPGLSAAMDIGRRGDRTVITIGDEVEGLAIMRGLLVLARMPFAEQRKIAREVAAAVQESGGRFPVDATGLGMQMAEELRAEFPCVEEVTFTAALKEQWAVSTKRRMEEHTLRLAEHLGLRRAFCAIKRTMGPTGVMRFDAARTDAGHADEFWATALWLSGMQQAGRYIPASEGGLVGETNVGNLMEVTF